MDENTHELITMLNQLKKLPESTERDILIDRLKSKIELIFSNSIQIATLCGNQIGWDYVKKELKTQLDVAEELSKKV